MFIQFNYIHTDFCWFSLTMMLSHTFQSRIRMKVQSSWESELLSGAAGHSQRKGSNRNQIRTLRPGTRRWPSREGWTSVRSQGVRGQPETTGCGLHRFVLPAPRWSQHSHRSNGQFTLHFISRSFSSQQHSFEKIIMTTDRIIFSCSYLLLRILTRSWHRNDKVRWMKILTWSWNSFAQVGELKWRKGG